MSENRIDSRPKVNRNSSDSKAASVPIREGESVQLFKDRLKEIVADRKLVWFANECGFSDSLLGAYLRGGKLPGLENLVAMASAGGVTVDWLATGRLPKTRAELRATTQQSQSQGNSVAGGAQLLDTYRLAVEVVQEWQLEQGRFLPLDKFQQVIELLVDLSHGEPEEVRNLSAKVLSLAA